MSPSVRPPDTSAINARRQCGGDWSFFYECACDFVTGAERKLQEELDRTAVQKIAHSLKTGAELLCMTTIANAAFMLETASASEECDSLELLELQSVLLEHVLGTKIALQSPSVVSDPAAALERVEGHVDKLRRSPSLPAGLNHLTGGSDDQIRPVTPGSSPATGGGGAGMVGGTSVVASGYRRRTPLPPSVAVVSSDSTTRRIVAGAISASSSSIDIACFETLEEASWAPDTRVVVFCPSPDAPFRSSTVLPRTMPTGKLRGFVIVGDVQQDAAETVYSSDVGWCELVRMPLVSAELVRRIGSVYAATIAEL